MTAKKLKLHASGREAKSWLELPEPMPSLLGAFIDDGRGAFAEVKSNVKLKPGRSIKFPHGLVTDTFEKIGLYATEHVAVAEGHHKDRRKILIADKYGVKDLVDAPPLG